MCAAAQMGVIVCLTVVLRFPMNPTNKTHEPEKHHGNWRMDQSDFLLLFDDRYRLLCLA
jgi:hypothetical protein